VSKDRKQEILARVIDDGSFFYERPIQRDFQTEQQQLMKGTKIQGVVAA